MTTTIHGSMTPGGTQYAGNPTKEGHDAFLAGKPINANPYSQGMAYWRYSWCDGWRKAERGESLDITGH